MAKGNRDAIFIEPVSLFFFVPDSQRWLSSDSCFDRLVLLRMTGHIQGAHNNESSINSLDISARSTTHFEDTRRSQSIVFFGCCTQRQSGPRHR